MLTRLAGWTLVLGLCACAEVRAAARTEAPVVSATAEPVRASRHADSPFTFSARPLDRALRRRMTGVSWHEGCPVALSDLRVLRIGHWGFDRKRHVGRMVVAASSVDAVRTAFAALYSKRFPIRRMRLVDDYGGSDYASIEADNTSAFNCRAATGSSRFSEHAYGRAIDINPIENPYVYPDGTTVHRASRPYLKRSHHRRGMAFRGGVLVQAFARAGWSWGGLWRPPSGTDYQHFSSSGR